MSKSARKQNKRLVVTYERQASISEVTQENNLWCLVSRSIPTKTIKMKENQLPQQQIFHKQREIMLLCSILYCYSNG